MHHGLARSDGGLVALGPPYYFFFSGEGNFFASNTHPHATGLAIENEDPLVMVGRKSDHRAGLLRSAHHAVQHDGYQRATASKP